jgi:signal transduction histidine kinase/tetratricopeptide (TPR) repeat protein
MPKNLTALAWMLLSIALIPQVCAQERDIPLDSLLNELSTSDEDKTEKIFKKVEKKLKYGTKEAVATATTIRATTNALSNPLAKVLSAIIQARAFDATGNQSEALKYYQESLSIAKDDVPGTYTEAVALFYLGQYLREQELFSKSFNYLLEAEKIYAQLKKDIDVINARYEMCIIDYKVENFQQCIHEANDIIQAVEEAKKKGLEIEEFQLMSTYNTLALAYRAQKNYTEALKNFDHAAVIAENLHNEFWIGLISGNKALILRETGRLEEASENLFLDLRTSKKFKSWVSATNACVSLSGVYLAQNNLPLAQQYLDSAYYFIALTDDKNAKRRLNITYLLGKAKLEGSLHHYDRAYDLLMSYTTLRDSLDKIHETVNTAKLRASYELDRKQIEIEELIQSNSLQQVHLKNQRNLFVIALGTMVLLVIFLIYLVRNSRRQKQVGELIRQQRDEIEEKNAELEAQSMQLQENYQLIQSLNAQLEQKVADRTRELEQVVQELDTFLYRSSHDIRRPITTLLGLKQIASRSIQDDQAMFLFEKVSETAYHMDNMLFKMQMLYELNKPMRPMESVDLNAVLQKVERYFNDELKRLNIGFVIDAQTALTLFSNSVLIEIILRNLIENAILFRKTHIQSPPYIHITASVSNAHIRIVVEDNGMGIQPEYLSSIFDLYFRASHASKGSGLGLYLVKRAVEKLCGTLHVQSTFGEGTSFTVSLPVK